MEQINQPRGDADEITAGPYIQPDHEVVPPEVPVYQVEQPGQCPPVTFAEAEAHNPFALLSELHDHAMALRLHEKPPTFHLTELALSAAAVAWWSRWQPIAMHRAFIAGASLAEVAAAVGTTEAEAYQRWNTWAEAQSKLEIRGRLGVGPSEVAAIRNRLGRPHAVG